LPSVFEKETVKSAHHELCVVRFLRFCVLYRLLFGACFFICFRDSRREK